MKRYTRRQNKQRWIRAKNLMRKYPECNYGDFYCEFIYDPENPWVWVDFRFFHSKKKRYYAVAMQTAEYETYTIAEERAIDDACDKYPFPDRIFDEPLEVVNQRREFIEQRVNELLVPTLARPKIELKDYGPVAVGMFAVVNTPTINEHVIREFIAFFRSLGEPVSAGWRWQGEEVQVDPRRLQAPR